MPHRQVVEGKLGREAVASVVPPWQSHSRPSSEETMRGKRVNLASFLAPIAVLALASAGCVDEKIVYQERELFETPPAAAASFLGYSNEENKLSVCGNCHVGQSIEWKNTAHADAWDTLLASGHAAEHCEACHTVSELGNHIEGDVGYVSTGDARYHDVQCESCHGPGLGHVTNPDGGLVPLAPISVGLDLSTGCGECHQGTHHPFVEEWQQSRHATAAANGHGASCDPCHNAGGVFAAWGVDAVYEEKGTGEEMHMGIVCAVCHDPHDGGNEGQLRFPIDEPSEEGNLCMKCHHKRGTPDPTTFRGAHSPEGPVLLGYGGWWPPNMGAEGGSIVATHGSEANPRLCAGCHVNHYEVTDEAGQLRADGHGSPVPGHPVRGRQRRAHSVRRLCHAGAGLQHLCGFGLSWHGDGGPFAHEHGRGAHRIPHGGAR